MKNRIIVVIVFLMVVLNNYGYGQSLVWVDEVGVVNSGTTVTKTDITAWGNGGAASQNTLSAGTDGWVEFNGDQTNTGKVFGVSSSNTSAHYNDIDFSISLSGSGIVYVFESGVNVQGSGFGTYLVSDVFRIERTSGLVTYKKNGTTFYASSINSTSPWIIDLAIKTNGGSFSQVQGSFFSSGSGGGGGNNSGNGGGVWSSNGDNIYYNTGNVAVGDSTGTGQLYVKNDSTGQSGLVINQTVDTDTTYALELQVATTSSKAFSIAQGGSTQFQINGNGKAYAREVEVTLNPFPDYVFEDDYNLMPLDQLQIFIEENKHLPNIPAGKEIDANGIGLGDLSHKQMEKIEELTLYLLQMNERLEKLEAENKELKEEILKLKK